MTEAVAEMTVTETTCQHRESAGHDSCLRQVPIFNELSEPEISVLTKAIHSRRYRKGQFVFEAGQPSDALYVIHHGVVKITTVSDAGKERILRFLFSGDFDGLFALFKEDVHYAYAEAVEDTVVCRINRNDLKAILDHNADLAYRLLALLSERLRDADEWAGSMSFMDAESRLAKMLLILSTRVVKSGVHQLPVTKKDLAALIGTTPETLSRKLAAFESEGYILLTGKKGLRILNASALEQIVGVSVRTALSGNMTSSWRR